MYTGKVSTFLHGGGSKTMGYLLNMIFRDHWVRGPGVPPHFSRSAQLAFATRSTESEISPRPLGNTFC